MIAAFAGGRPQPKAKAKANDNAKGVGRDNGAGDNGNCCYTSGGDHFARDGP